ncbi:MAG: OmpA family protein [Bacteroidota bacterium]
MNKLHFFRYIVFLPLVFYSCVSSKQFNELQARKDSCEAKNEELLRENERLQVANNEFVSKLEVMENAIEELEQDSLEKTLEIKRIKRQNDRLETQYQDLEYSLESLRQGSAAETKKLLRQLQNTQEDLQRREDELDQLEANLQQQRANLNGLREELNERTQRLAELEDILNKKDSAVNALRAKVSNALLGFTDEGLKVTMKNGKVYVSLEENLLFPSGSTVVDPKGVDALRKLARVLEQNPDINIMIEGHTDDVPVRAGSSFKDNWGLSVQRATAIVRILLDSSSIDPKRLIAAGRGEHMPLVPNDSPEARQKNRRTEIILTPKLDELFQILETN